MTQADALRRLAADLQAEARPDLTYMEVCGTHTMAIARYGLRELLPDGMRLVSGPGCPVCVTAIADLDRVVALARLPEVTLATFGDLIRVPASCTTLAAERAAGADVRVVYSARDAVQIAADEPDRQVVFAGIGFETTAPTVAASLLEARAPRSRQLLGDEHAQDDAAAAQGAARVGGDPDKWLPAPRPRERHHRYACYEFLARDYGVAGVVAGFEPHDVMRALLRLVRQAGPAIEIEYGRAVRPEGNVVARRLMEQVFQPSDADWRGLGVIPGSGLALRPEYADADAALRFPVSLEPPLEPAGCRCGEVLRGVTDPADCALFAARCTPEDPVGACMVSSEGACAARFRFRGLDD